MVFHYFYRLNFILGLMVKKNIFNALLLAVLATSTSCIREEAPNAECDILGIDEGWLELNRDIITGTPVIGNYSVDIAVKEGTDCTSLEPLFILTPGAHITKDSICDNGPSGVTLHYTTYAEDGIWRKKYTVSFTIQAAINASQVFGFEDFEVESSGRYNVWFEIDVNGTRRNIWASGNAGFAFLGIGKSPMDFPTAPDPAGVKGNCIRLTTKETGSYGSLFNMPIAAGNIFIGEFHSASAMGKPLEATRFGQQMVPGKPLYLKGYYKYSSGDVFTDKHKNGIPGRTDECAIYSVLYEVDPANFEKLDGSDITTSERIVMMAEIENPGTPGMWTEFRIPFKAMNGKEFDPHRLATKGYAITIVASSSKDGASFEGAVGSTLYIDELAIEWETEEQQ